MTPMQQINNVVNGSRMTGALFAVGALLTRCNVDDDTDTKILIANLGDLVHVLACLSADFEFQLSARPCLKLLRVRSPR